MSTKRRTLAPPRVAHRRQEERRIGRKPHAQGSMPA